MELKKGYFGFLGVLAGLCLVQACSEPLKPEESCGFVQNSQYRRVSWSSDKIVLHVDSSVPSQYVDAIERAAANWNTKLNQNKIEIVKNSSKGTPLSAQKDGVSKVYWKSTWDANRPNEQARTTVYWQGESIYESDVQLNAFNFSYFTDGEPVDFSKVHLESLLVHEFGHVLGLAHREDSGSVMKTSLLNGYIRDEPGHVDMSSLSCEY